jgi:hypothetical protein
VTCWASSNAHNIVSLFLKSFEVSKNLRGLHPLTVALGQKARQEGGRKGRREGYFDRRDIDSTVAQRRNP